MVDNRSVESLDSDDSSNEVRAFEQPVALLPLGVNDSKPSIGRRISNAASGYFSIMSNDHPDLKDSNESDEADLPLYNNDAYFGRSQLINSMSRRGTKPDLEHGKTLVSGQEDQPQTPVARKESFAVSTVNSVKKKLGFWDKEFRESRMYVYTTFGINYLYIITGFVIALCIYWGAYYGRSGRYKNLKFVVINADEGVGQLPAIVGPTMISFFTQVPIMKTLGSFDIWDLNKIATLATSNNNTITEEVYRLVHHQKYWAAFYIHENSTLNWYQALKSASPNFSLTQSFLELVFETGHDSNAVNTYVSSVLQSIIRVYFSFIPQSSLTYNMVSLLNQTEFLNVMNNAPALVTSMPTWFINDRIPVINQLYQIPFQIGIIYLVVFAFFQFLFTIKVHMYLATKIFGWRYVLYRITTAQVAYVFISLGFVVLNTAFQLPFTTTFGKLGFLVIWSFAFLTMSSLGSLIEMLVLIVAGIKQQFIGFIMLFIAVLNVAPTVSPIVLCPPFYRYGYAIPARNSYELFQVAYFNSWKGNMGRNIGILIAWIVCTNAALPFVMKWVANKMAKAKAAKEGQTEIEDEFTKEEVEETARIDEDNGEQGTTSFDKRTSTSTSS